MRSEADWSVLEIDGVEGACDAAARRFLRRSPDHARHTHSGDVHQEARFAAARDPESVRRCTAAGSGVGLGVLVHRLYCDLLDRYKRALRHDGKHESYEARYIEPEADPTLPRARLHIVPDLPTDTYSAKDVVALLRPAIDRETFWAILAEVAVDPDMPRAKPVLSSGFGVATGLADVTRVWSVPEGFGGLTDKQRRALFLTAVLDWRVADAARHECVSHQAISDRKAAGLARLVTLLNQGVPRVELAA